MTTHGDEFRQMTAKLEQLSPAERINALLKIRETKDKRLTSQFVDQECTLKEITVLSSRTAKATYTFKVSRFYCNGSGNLHGGAQVRSIL